MVASVFDVWSKDSLVVNLALAVQEQIQKHHDPKIKTIRRLTTYCDAGGTPVYEGEYFTLENNKVELFEFYLSFHKFSNSGPIKLE